MKSGHIVKVVARIDDDFETFVGSVIFHKNDRVVVRNIETNETVEASKGQIEDYYG